MNFSCFSTWCHQHRTIRRERHSIKTKSEKVDNQCSCLRILQKQTKLWPIWLVLVPVVVLFQIPTTDVEVVTPAGTLATFPTLATFGNRKHVSAIHESTMAVGKESWNMTTITSINDNNTNLATWNVVPSHRSSSQRQPPTDPYHYFIENCFMENQEDWWPSNPSDWRLRTPAFLLIGAKKAGTTTLWDWLLGQTFGSSEIIVRARTKELLNFMPKFFPSRHWKNYKVHVDRVRESLWNYSNTNNRSRPDDQSGGGGEEEEEEQIQAPFYSARKMIQNPNYVTYEATPDYLLYSTISRIPILCTFPWVKLLVVLRDPVERTISNHRFDEWMALLMSNHTIPSFDSRFHWELKRLQRVLNSTDSSSERLAWQQYQRDNAKSSASSIVGRSLYIIQLEEWYDGLRELGRDPSKEILVVRNEDMKTRPQFVMEQILSWLAGSPQHVSQRQYSSRMITQSNATPISEAVHQQLRQFFEPYNQRLYRLIGWGSDMQWQYL